MNKMIAAAVAVSAGIVLASAAYAADPNCPTCKFVTGAVSQYAVGVQCTYVKLDSLDSSVPDNNHWFTINANQPAFQAMSDMLHAAFLSSVFTPSASGGGTWSGEVVEIEHNSASGANDNYGCAATLDGISIFGAKSFHSDEANGGK